MGEAEVAFPDAIKTVHDLINESNGIPHIDNDAVLDTKVPPAVPLAPATNSTTSTLLRYRLAVTAFLFIILVCLAWTLWLLSLTISPSETMNRVMNTGQFDDGAFWLVFDPLPSIVGLGVAGLAVIVLGYLAIPFSFLQFRREQRVLSMRKRRMSRHVSASLRSVSAKLESFQTRFNQGTKARQTFTVMLKIGDLLVQCVLLGQLLEAGMPVPLVSFYACIVAVNALVAGLFAALLGKNDGVTHVVVDTAFDFIIAIVFPVTVLGYSIRSFDFNYTLMDVNIQTFNSAAFERIAAVNANPVTNAIIRRSFDSLRIRSVLDIFTRVGVNLMLCIHFHALAKLLAASRSHQVTLPSCYPRRKPISLLFVAIAIAVLVVTGSSIRAAEAVCRPHLECVQHAHRWVSAHKGNCPCIAIIDRELIVRSYEEWTNPVDVTDKIAALARSGDVQTLQLVNRGLPTLPDMLRRCKQLKYLELIYTDTTALPEWANEFTNLEYFHIEGKTGINSLQQLPLNLFARMKSLVLIHLGQHELSQLPSLVGLERVQVLSLAVLPQLEGLPSFQSLTNLKRITLAYTPRLEVLPDLAPVKDLQGLTSYDRGAFCCNGFLNGSCDLSDPKCGYHPLFGTPPATCLPKERQATPATLAYFQKFAPGLCVGGAQRFAIAPSETLIRQCNGTLFAHCAIPGFEPVSICYNQRWMAIDCVVNPFAIAMRRMQIAKGVGLRCDPTHEAWLGCK